jgi:hypothetical protein
MGGVTLSTYICERFEQAPVSVLFLVLRQTQVQPKRAAVYFSEQIFSRPK